MGELLLLLIPERLPPKIKPINSGLLNFCLILMFLLIFFIFPYNPGDNWRLKASNLKKIVDSVVQYYSEELELSLDAHLKPEVVKIAEYNDIREMEKLLKLILGLAVNCNEKQTYITQIMEMEESVQRNIMKALQEIENIGGSSSARNSLNLSSEQAIIMKDDREMLAQQCHEKDNKISILLDEKITFQQEIQRLQKTVDKYENPGIIGDDAMSLGNPMEGSQRYNELRKQVEALKNDLLLSDTMKEDLKMKSSQQEVQISILQSKIEELTKASNELAQIKDEVDILREASEKSKIYETQVATYKKKLEDYNDLKRQLKQYEDRAAEYLKQNMQYEDEAKKFTGLRGQMELYKKELEELHSKLDTEMQKTVKAEFDLQVMQTKIAGIQRERDNLLSQRDSLQEKIDEFQAGVGDEDSANISRELLGDSSKEKISRLEAENKALREGQGGQTALSDLLNDANQRNEKLREQLKICNQKILHLTSQNVSDDEKNKSGTVELRDLCETRERLLEEAQSQITNSHTRIRQLETSLETKNQELTSLEMKYRKCVEKAKEVIKGLDPRILGEAMGLDNVAVEPPENDCMSVMESRLLASAFYRMALNTQRETVDSKLASLSQGQSFMARQRQPAARKPINTNTFKK